MDKDLTITIHSDYSNEFNTVANIYNNPTLNASAPGYSDSKYQDPECDIINVGGMPSWITGDQHLTFTSSMVPFSAGSQEMKDEVGHPLFGYSTEKNADDFWKNNLLADAQEGDKLYVEKLMAIYGAPARSAVIDSVCVFAVAKVAPEAEGEVVIECPGEKAVVAVRTLEPTAITDVTATKTAKVVKVVENGQVYILSGDKKYNMMGVEVK